MNKGLEDLKVAIVADWLTDRGGAERVVLAFAEMFPEADIFTSVYKAENFPELASRKVVTSYMQNWPFKNRHQLFAWARPQAMESLNLDDYDLVLSSSSAEAKGIITKPETLHICYCHTPTRYYWSHYADYLKANQFGAFDFIFKWFAPSLIKSLRVWDRAAADRPDVMLANSHYIATRIKKYYDREAFVVHAPVDFERFANKPSQPGDYYLILGRQIPYKKTDLAVAVFNQLMRPLKVIGDGPELPRLRTMATSGEIEFLGRLKDEEITDYLLHSKALIFPQEEDFGIVPLEAMAAGKPVIAYGVGGATETVVDGETGILFDAQTEAGLRGAIERFESRTFDSAVCRARAEEFSVEKFEQKMFAVIADAWEKHETGGLEWK